MNIDSLQNEIIVIEHHLADMSDALSKLDKSSVDILKSGIKDISESLDRLKSLMPKNSTVDIERIAEGLL